MSSGQSVLYNETALDKYEYSLIFREQMMELDLGKERFPTLADAVDEIIRMASGTGRMDMDGETLGDASFPRMVFFSYGGYVIGEAVLENAELELDKDLRPIRETYLFDKDTVAVHFIPMPCKEFSRQWDALWKELDLATLYDYLCYLPVEFCRSRFYPAGRKNEIYLLPEAGGSAINQDELNSMALKICNAVNRSDMPGLSCHWPIRLHGDIRIQQREGSTGETAIIENDGMQTDTRGSQGKALILGEYDRDAGEVVLYVHTILLCCIMENRGSKGEGLGTLYRTKVFSILKRALLCAIRSCGQEQQPC